eukprot:gene10942-22842_t
MSPQSPNVVPERKTFKRFMQVELWRTPELEDLFPILCSIENACRDVNRLMRRISTDNLYGDYTAAGGGGGPSVNIQGEDQKKLDVIANRILKTAICISGKVDMVASEEDDDLCSCSAIGGSKAFTGNYVAVFDPLDGSSNIDGGLPTGTIFGVYKKPTYGSIDKLSTVQQKGTELLVAGYCLYSASTHLVITIRNGVNQFTLDDVTGEFYLTRTNIQIPKSGPIYSVNDANSAKWHPHMRKFFDDFRTQKLQNVSNTAKPVARYMGALVADIHNILRKGGLFAYPAEISKPNGKLRMLYEAIPLAMLVEQAGGKASSGTQRILDMQIKDIHERTPLFIGSADEVSSVEKYISSSSTSS